MNGRIVFSLYILFLMYVPFTRALEAESKVHMANGIKIGEVDQDSAILWMRLTKNAERKRGGKSFSNVDGKDGHGVENLDAHRGSVPGTAGEVRATYWPKSDDSKRLSTPWEKVDPDKDFTRQFTLEKLTPKTSYALRVEGRANASDESPCVIEGGFRTAPTFEDPSPVTFAVMTCQEYRDRDDKQNGFKIYRSILNLDPDFMVNAGDIIYFDKPKPYATNLATARFKWNRMYSLPFQRTLHNQMSSYFMKDDHDTLKDDCWPGQKYGDLTFEQGRKLFLEQAPMGENTYRTYRWGKDLQVWFVEGRDFRSPNKMEDGPDKTIWGEKQKKWFFDSVKNSDAAFRLLISPTPLVGPDLKRKRDNHSNFSFQHEAKEVHDFIASQKNMVVICGDRHWQYVSVDPRSKVREYSCGPASDEHAGSFTEEQRTPAHVFLRLKGGFMTVLTERKEGKPSMTLRHHAVNGKVVHEDVVTSP